uniref:Gp5 n=1 Tax=Caviid herpesvirus 2 str. CIDMTR TaxID=1415526 RepID=U6H6M0_9BETA|nr:gp5 [Caviid herpesvirus 2 str. CIDMTR]
MVRKDRFGGPYWAIASVAFFVTSVRCANDVPINATDHIMVWMESRCISNVSDCSEPQTKIPRDGILNCSGSVTDARDGHVLSYTWICKHIDSDPVFVDPEERAVVVAFNMSVRMRDTRMEWILPEQIRGDPDVSDRLTAIGDIDVSGDSSLVGITSGCDFESGSSLPRLFGMDYSDDAGEVIYHFRMINPYARISESVHMAAYIYITYPDNSTGFTIMDLIVHEDHISSDGLFRSKARLFAYTSGSTLRHGSCVVEAVDGGIIDRPVAHSIRAPFLESGRSHVFLIICIAGICSSACLVIWVVSYVSWRYVSTRRKSIDDTTRMKTDEQPPDVVIGDAPWYPAAFDNKGATLDMEEIEIRSDETS